MTSKNCSVVRPVRPKNGMSSWLWVAIAAIAVSSHLIYARKAESTDSPREDWAPELAVAREGGRLSVGWDRRHPAIRAGSCGVLLINDGSVGRQLVLDASRLGAGKLFYWPQTNRVSFELLMLDGTIGTGPFCNNDEPSAGQSRSYGESASNLELPSFPAQHRPRFEGVNAKEVIVDRQGWIMDTRWTRAIPIAMPEPPPVELIPPPVTATEKILAGAPPPAHPSFVAVTLEADEERPGRLVNKLPAKWTRRRRPPLVPPSPVHEADLVVPSALRRKLTDEMLIDIRVYVDKEGKVKYAELASEGADRDFASLAVFNARHWGFVPAQVAGNPVPGEVILHYRFSNPLLASFIRSATTPVVSTVQDRRLAIAQRNADVGP